MCSTVPKAIGAQAASRSETPAGTGITKSCGQVDQVACKAVNMKAHDAADILAKVVAAFTAGGTSPASHRPIHHDLVGRLEAGDAITDRSDFTGGFGANNER